MLKSSPFLHLKTWDPVLLSKKVVYASFSGEGAGGLDADEVVGGVRIALRCLGLTTFQPGDKGGVVWDVGVVDACMEAGREELVKDAGGAVLDSEYGLVGVENYLSSTYLPNCLPTYHALRSLWWQDLRC